MTTTPKTYKAKPPKTLRRKLAKAALAARGGALQTQAVKTRSRATPMSDEDYNAAVALGDKQPSENMKGGIGIIGPRTADEVKGLRELPLRSTTTALKAILAMSKTIRELRDEGGATIEEQRKKVETVNRRVVYSSTQMGHHSLHVGNDIAAVWNSLRNGSKIYDYADLAPKLDVRLSSPQRGRTKSGETYWNKKKGVSDTQRRTYVAQSLKHLVDRKPNEAGESLNQAGITERGRKWIYKMATILLAERAREIYGGSRKTLVATALGHLRTKTFKEVFVTESAQLAPFAVRGGAKKFKLG